LQVSRDVLPHYAPLLFAAFCVALFAVLWSVVSLVNSLLGGWRALSRRFGKRTEPRGEIRRAGPFLMGVYTRFWTDYSGLIRVTVAEDALYLSVLLPLRIGHPPLSIPWHEIQISTTRRFWQRFVVLTLGSEERIPLRISERIASRLGILEKLHVEAHLR
jgi:hypothetical protein